MNEVSRQTIKGYHLQEQIGSGGYGTVYRAHQPLVGRDVAIKIIHPGFANHPDFIRRFEAEAHLVARLEHPHIVPLYDYWRDADGAFLVMRWLRAGSLHAALEQGPLPLDMILRMLDQIAAALTVAHRRGVVHRDIKPDNILLDEDGNAYLADFGIAKDLADSSSLNTRAQVIGSPEYLSPEQIEHGPVTPQTDIYSLGILLFEVLTGDIPFPDLPLLALLYKHVHDPLPSILERRPDLPAALDAVIQRATAKQPAQRYPDVLSMVRDVRKAVMWSELTAKQPDAAHSDNGGNGGNGHVPQRRSTRYQTQQLADLAVLDVPAPPLENPYKGLRAFQEADAADFFGRERLIRRLLSRLQEPGEAGRFLAVVGPSGSGKSSVVRAGLIPSLRRGSMPGSQRWFIVEMFPGADPMAELATALLRVAINPPANIAAMLNQDTSGLQRVVQQILPGDSSTELVLVIDQFEEVFTRVDDEAARAHFLQSLAAAVTVPHSRIRVVVTLRADFYDRPLMYSDFSELMRQRTEVVVPLTTDELRAAIVRPAERSGLKLDEDLVDAIVRDVGTQPGMLPLLQYALTELFEYRAGRTITLTPYRAAGGVAGALARRAEEIFVGLDAPQREAAEQLFLRLVTLGEGTEDTRRRVRRADLAAVAGDARTLDSVIDVYCSYRLLTLDIDPGTREPTVEIAHEALIRTWERLRKWLDASRDDLRLQRRLGAAANEWQSANRDSSFLASGARLEQFAAWADSTNLALNDVEQQYLRASLAERDALAAQEAERQAHERSLEQRSRKVLRALVVVSLLAAIGGLGLAGTALYQRQVAQSERDRAVAAEATAESAALDAEREANNAKQSAALAAEAEQRAETAAERARREEAIARNQALTSGAQAALLSGNTDLAIKLAVQANSVEQPLPAAQAILSQAAFAPGTLRVFEGHTEAVNRVALSPDGSRVVSGGKDNAIILWDVATGQEIRRFEGKHERPIKGIMFHPDGKQIIVGSEDNTLSLWNADTGAFVRSFTGHTDEIKGAALSPDGRRMLSASADTTLILWDVTTGQPIRTLAGHTQEVHAVAFSPDGTRAVSASQDTTLILWDLESGDALRTFKGHTGEVRAVAFVPDGRRFISGGNDNTLILWDAETGDAIGSRFIGHTRPIYAVATTPDGKHALSGGEDELIIQWDLNTAAPIHQYRGHGGYIRDISVSADGQTFISASIDTTLRQWALRNGAELAAADAGRALWSGAISPDGKTVVTGAIDGSIQIWRPETGDFQHIFAHERGIRAVRFSPDGTRALSAGDEGDGAIILWDTTAPEWQIVRIFSATLKGTNSVDFLPDGQHFVAAGGDNTMTLWNIEADAPVKSFGEINGAVSNLVVLPDGQRVLAVVGDNLSLWNIDSGEQILAFDEGHTARINAVAVSPDGKTALSGAADKLLIAWDIASGKAVWQSDPQAGELRALGFHPSAPLALVVVESELLLWDLNLRQPIRVYDGHTKELRTALFTPDGRSAVSASADNSVRLWRIDATPADLVSWTREHRFVPPLTEAEQEIYGIAP